jgi:hypothetical protein
MQSFFASPPPGAAAQAGLGRKDLRLDIFKLFSDIHDFLIKASASPRI